MMTELKNNWPHLTKEKLHDNAPGHISAAKKFNRIGYGLISRSRYFSGLPGATFFSFRKVTVQLEILVALNVTNALDLPETFQMS